MGIFFIKWLRILYKNANSAIITNGYISEYFSIKRGVRQGDSLSALLYILQAEPLANEIRKSPDLKGICLESKDHVKEEYLISQYVDDTNIMLQNITMVQPCLNIISEFNTASGSKTNCSKTKCLISQEHTENDMGIEMTKGPERALGIPIGVNIEKDQLWLSKIVKLKSCLNVWKTRNLTYKGKVHLIKCYGLSNIMYTIEAADPSKPILDEINKVLWGFLWSGKSKGKVKREICILPRKLGGLDMPDISKIITTRRVKFVLNAINKPYEKWKFLARKCFSTFDVDYKLEYFMLKVTDSTLFIHTNIPDFYKNCILQFQMYLRSIKIDSNDRDEVLNEIIWHNHQIRFNGKPLNWRHWGKSGLLRIRDIVNNRGLIDEVKIRRRLRHISNIMFELRILKKAIPMKWLAILRQGIDHNIYEIPVINDISQDQSIVVANNTTAKYIYDKLISFHAVANRSIPYWEHKFRLADINWENVFLYNYNNKLLPRKIHDFNWKVFYGCLPIESRLHTMRLSDGLCKLCSGGLENLEHLLYNCIRLDDIWQKLSRRLNLNFDTYIALNYKTIIVGDLSLSNDVNQIVDMLISILKWEIWLRRNEFIFESTYRSSESIWKSFLYSVKNHSQMLIRSNNLKKKKKIVKTLLTCIIDSF